LPSNTTKSIFVSIVESKIGRTNEKTNCFGRNMNLYNPLKKKTLFLNPKLLVSFTNNYKEMQLIELSMTF